MKVTSPLDWMRVTVGELHHATIAVQLSSHSLRSETLRVDQQKQVGRAKGWRRGLQWSQSLPSAFIIGSKGPAASPGETR